VREKAEFAWFGEVLKKHGIVKDFTDASLFYEDLVNHFNPVTVREPLDVIQDALDLLQQHVIDLRKDIVTDVDSAVAAIGLPPTRSNKGIVRHVLANNRLLGPQPKRLAGFVKLVDGNGVNEPPPPPKDEPKQDEPQDEPKDEAKKEEVAAD